MRKVLVTGGLGFIGSNLISTLHKYSDYRVTILDRVSLSEAIACNPSINKWLHLIGEYDEEANSKLPIGLISQDLRSVDLDHLALDHDVIIHLAANTGVQPSINNPLMDFEENIAATFSILEAIRKCPRDCQPSFVFSSSVAPLAGNTQFPLSEKLAIRPLSPYGASKASCEAYIQAYISSFSLKATILRFSNIYGPGSLGKSSVVARMIRDSILKSEITIFGSGNQVRDFVFIDDLVNVLIWAMNRSLPHPVHICSGVPTKILDIASMVISAIGQYSKTDILCVHQDALVGDAETNYSSPQTLLDLGGVKIRPVSSRLIEDTVDFFLENQNLLLG